MAEVLRASEFDSTLFERRIGKASVSASEALRSLALELEEFDGAFVAVRDLSLVPAVCRMGEVGAIDPRYEFAKPDAGRGHPWPETMRPVTDEGEIHHLIRQTFLISRFYKDPRTAGHADDLYRLWLTRGIESGRVMAYLEDGSVTGYIFHDVDGDGSGRHVLAAVDAQVRGRGIYRAMITASEHAFSPGRTARGKVSVDNVGPVRVLLSLGYLVDYLETVVHVWR